MRLIILNGPNLNLLGKREPAIYGTFDFESYIKKLQKEFPKITLHAYQSNSEAELIGLIHQHGFNSNGLIINAGALTHTSIAIADAIAAVPAPAIEVHISNVAAREPFRHQSFLSAKCKGVISGFGLSSYRLAVFSFTDAP